MPLSGLDSDVCLSGLLISLMKVLLERNWIFARFGRDFRLRRGRSADLVCVGFLVDEGNTVGTGFGFGRERRVRLEGLFDGGASDLLGWVCLVNCCFLK